jgi:putative endonuclease
VKSHEKAGYKNRIGAHGEQIARTYLERNGFTILDTNINYKWGEIDIAASYGANGNKTIHIVEVKTVTRGTVSFNARPEEQFHYKKLCKVLRATQTFLMAQKLTEIPYQLDGIIVRLTVSPKSATVQYIPHLNM